MTCSRWRCLATALPPPWSRAARLLSREAPRRGKHTGSGSDSGGDAGVLWPQLKRKASDPVSFAAEKPAFAVGQLKRRGAEASVPDRASDVDDAGADTSKDADTTVEPPRVSSSSDTSRLMLIFTGLSPNLKASDFQRLVPSELSSWNVIKFVQQKRDPKTLEPLGTYYVTFSSAAALSVYHDKFLRLHALNKHRLRGPPETWQLSIPAHLRSGTDDLEAEVDSFTLAPGSQVINPPIRRRAGVAKSWWAGKLSARVQHFGYGLAPPTVLLHIYPPTVTADELARVIMRDGRYRGCAWDVCKPLPLETEDPEQEAGPKPVDTPAPEQETPEATLQSTQHDGPEHARHAADNLDQALEDTPGSNEPRRPRQHVQYSTQSKIRSRFVIVCATEAEAYRFHRYWNQRIIQARPWRENDQNIVHASKINW